VQIRHGRATVSGELPAVTAGSGGKAASERAMIRESGYCQAIRVITNLAKKVGYNVKSLYATLGVAFALALPHGAARAADVSPSP